MMDECTRVINNKSRWGKLIIALIISSILPLIIYRFLAMIFLMMEPMMRTGTFLYAIVVLMFVSFIFPFIDGT